jgi:hypothetical protein
MKRTLRVACNKAIWLEQRDWPRKPEAIARSLRVFAYAESKGAYDGRV